CQSGGQGHSSRDARVPRFRPPDRICGEASSAMMTAPEDARDAIEQIVSNARVPLATYRLQFNRDFTFRQGTEIAEYLHDLGISDCYSSPIFNAGPQSTHGYDICDFNQLNPQLGTPADFDQLTSHFRQFALGLMLDMVLYHM